MTDYALVLTALYPESLWGLNDNDLATLVWDGSNADAMPTQAVLDAAWPTVQYDRAYKQVELTRRARYRDETDGMFFAAQRDGNDLAEWVAAVDQIKTDLPYPEATVEPINDKEGS